LNTRKSSYYFFFIHKTKNPQSSKQGSFYLKKMGVLTVVFAAGNGQLVPNSFYDKSCHG